VRVIDLAEDSYEVLAVGCELVVGAAVLSAVFNVGLLFSHSRVLLSVWACSACPLATVRSVWMSV
jgi:hypothetical protein